MNRTPPGAADRVAAARQALMDEWNSVNNEIISSAHPSWLRIGLGFEKQEIDLTEPATLDVTFKYIASDQVQISAESYKFWRESKHWSGGFDFADIVLVLEQILNRRQKEALKAQLITSKRRMLLNNYQQTVRFRFGRYEENLSLPDGARLRCTSYEYEPYEDPNRLSFVLRGLTFNDVDALVEFWARLRTVQKGDDNA